ncbi:MAG: uracil-DNA glycosylase family protein [Muribaculaceae bacterium]|nr:uracil-DNA glycosylase family protein [Muribaculaceae bacterium]
MEQKPIEIETHPWEPFIPDGARVLIMGTFPPQPKRWSMDFFYPNRTNDFWFMMGLIFFGDKDALYDRSKKQFRLDDIKALLTREHIALFDTGYKIRRLKGNASDKFLEIVEPVHLYEHLEHMPQCHTVATTGEKAAAVISQLTDTPLPRMGERVESNDGLSIWRMPSTSRAFPMKLEDKARYYSALFDSIR